MLYAQNITIGIIFILKTQKNNLHIAALKKLKSFMAQSENGNDVFSHSEYEN